MNNEWIANAGVNITKSEIKYIKQCQGCDKVDLLVNVYNTFVDTDTILSYQRMFPLFL